jgi:DNA-binding response OmpR family regulator
VSPRGAPALRVLVVEDEGELGRIFGDYMAELGYEPDVVGSAEAALERLHTTPPHLIILDVKLPGMSGLEFLALKVVRDAGVPVVVVSGYVTEEQARRDYPHAF